MNLILLGGNSIENKQWLHDFSAVLHSHFASIYTHDYRHWETKDELIDLDYELATLSNLVTSRQPYIIIAKSAGVLVALKGIAQKILNPDKCVFLGTPILWAKENHFAVNEWLKEYSLQTLFIQQSHDPAMSFDDLQHYLHESNVQNYNMIDLPGKDHLYSELDEIKEKIVTFI